MACKWDSGDIFKLISLYEVKPELWDKTNKDFKDRIKRTRSLEEIAKTVNKSTAEISSKFRNLRTTYSSEFKKQNYTKSGSAASEKYVSSWEFFTALNFLGTNYKDSPTIDSMSTQGDNLNLDENSGGSGPSFEIEDDTESTTAHRPKKRYKSSKSTTSDLDAQHNAILHKAINIMSVEKKRDETDLIGEWITEKLKSIEECFDKRTRSMVVSGIQSYIASIECTLYASSIKLPAPPPFTTHSQTGYNHERTITESTSNPPLFHTSVPTSSYTYQPPSTAYDNSDILITAQDFSGEELSYIQL